MKKATTVASKERFRTTLQKAGYKATLPRLTILQFLYQQPKPVSAQEIVSALRSKPIDTVTVYRTLALLKKLGAVKTVDLGHTAAYYELSSPQEHHHIICTVCHKVEDVHDCCVEIDMNAKALRQSGFAHITAHSLEFFGVCNKCRA